MNKKRIPVNPTMVEFGKYLHKLRTKLKLTLRGVEKNTKYTVSNAYLSQIESGFIAEPSIKTINQLAKIYNISFISLAEKMGINLYAKK